MKKIILVILMMVLVHSVCFAQVGSIQNGTKEALQAINSLNDIPQPITIVPNLTASMTQFIIQTTPLNATSGAASQYYFYKQRDWVTRQATYFFSEIIGFQISFKNDSDNFYNIQWSGSNMSFGNFTGIPFIAGMQFTDAGKPNLTPDTLLPPHTRTTIKIYTSDVEIQSKSELQSLWTGDVKVTSSWEYNGQLIPVDNSMQLILNLKLTGNNNSSNYYSIKFPHIGVN